jgi:predicted anti-sigma-YlaC factor YlaD
MKCEEIQEVLFDYLSHEIGPTGRAELVRAHLLKCEECRKAAAEMQEVVKALQSAGRGQQPPEKLDPTHHQRIRWALMHPVLDWIFAHHIIVSIAITLLLALLAFSLLARAKLWDDPDTDVITVTIGRGAPPTIPPATNAP